MRTVRFLRDTDPSREGGSGYAAGAIVTLKDDSARRWVNRSAAEYVSEANTAGVAEKAPSKPVVTRDELDDLLGTGPAATDVKPEGGSNVNAVDGPADVAGQNGGDTGNGAKSDAAASDAGATVKATRYRGK